MDVKITNYLILFVKYLVFSWLGRDWIRDHLSMVMDFYFYSICKLRGDDCQSDDEPRKPGLPDYVAQPGNTNAQRLGLSEFKK